MENESIGEFTVLSPSQKKELERKRREQEEREEAEARRKAEAALKAKEAARQASEQRRQAAKRAAEARLVEVQRKEAEKITKKTLLGFLIVAIIILMIITLYYWFHLTAKLNGDADAIGFIIILILLGIIAVPILVGLGAAISGCSEKIKEIK